MKYFSLFSFSFLALIALLAWTSPQNDEWKQKVDTELLTQANELNTIDFIVQFEEKMDIATAKTLRTKEEKGAYVFETLKAIAAQSQAKVRQSLNDQGIEFQAFFLVNAIRVKGDLQLIQTLAEQTEVKRIVTNPSIQLAAPLVENTAQLRDPNVTEWGIEMIGADQVWNMGYTGQGVTVAGEDTGYDWEHPALSRSYRGWDGTTADHNYHWHDAIHEINPLHGDPTPDPSLNPCGLNSMVPCDDHNHGTHTMGTMVGEDGTTQIGVAPGAKWMACRNMERGYGTPATYIECFEFFLAPTDLNGENPRTDMAPHVINNSWGCPEMEGCNANNWSMMEEVVDNLKAAGIVVVVSAGNDGSSCSSITSPPAFFPNSFSVGATDINDVIAGFSSRGGITVDGSNRIKPNVSAPGRSVRSSIRDSSYASFSGTSMAGPHVAGAVALIISANPALAGQVEVIESILESTAEPKTSDQDCNGVLGTEIPNNTYGFGRIDVVRAVEAALLVTSADNPTVVAGAVKVSPNPFNDQVTINFENLEGPSQLRLFNAAGQEVLRQSLQLAGTQSETLQLAHLPKGVYFYRLDGQEKGFNGKLIKQ